MCRGGYYKYCVAFTFWLVPLIGEWGRLTPVSRAMHRRIARNNLVICRTNPMYGRTALLIAFVACSAKLSGAKAPALPYVGQAGSDGNSSSGGTVNEWVAFFAQGLALDLMGRHFAGIAPAGACMLVMMLLSLLVYPLHQMAQAAGVALGRPSAVFLFTALAVAVPGSLVWAVALWCTSHYWCGLASGMSVGLLSACLTLKTASFVHQNHAPCYGEIEKSPAISSPVCHDHPAIAVAPSAVSGTGAWSPSSLRKPLDFLDFLYFLLAVPSLACEPRFLNREARLSPRFSRAASEFLHAGLTFLALHAACSALVAPTMRIIAAATFSTERSGEQQQVGVPEWVNSSGWAELGTKGSGGWFSAIVAAMGGGEHEENCTSFLCGDSPGKLQTTLALALGIILLSPMVHFLTFYGFWHCVCLGYAELSGYPDRNLYGPWWLLTAETPFMFRLWSSPVHRWLASCIYRPLLGVGRACGPHRNSAVAHAMTSSDEIDGDATSSATQSAGDGDQTRKCAVSAGGGNFGSKGDSSSEQQRRGHDKNTPWWRLLAMLATFAFSSVVHEAVTFVAMRRTCWPFNTFCLIFAACVISGWDHMYPVKSLIAPKCAVASPSQILTTPETCPQPLPRSSLPMDGNDLGAGVVPIKAGVGGIAQVESVAGEESSHVRKSQPLVGAKWRGWGAVVFFMGTSCPTALVVDFLAWQWWRQTLLLSSD